MNPELELIERQVSEAIDDMLFETLDALELHVVAQWFGFDCEPKTMEETGITIVSRLCSNDFNHPDNPIGLSRERVRQIRYRALRKLQHPRNNKWLRQALGRESHSYWKPSHYEPVWAYEERTARDKAEWQKRQNEAMIELAQRRATEAAIEAAIIREPERVEWNGTTWENNAEKAHYKTRLLLLLTHFPHDAQRRFMAVLKTHPAEDQKILINAAWRKISGSFQEPAT